MRQRRLGATGLLVSEIGFGAWGIGGRTAGNTSYGETDDAQSLGALARALERGINFFDTAGAYGDGHSEALLGTALASCRDRVVIATKAGYRRFDEAPDYAPAQLRASLETSLRRLKTDHVDLLLLHSPPIAMLVAQPDVVATLVQLRAEGKIRAFGISVRTPEDGLVAIRDLGCEVVQVNLNMLDVRAEQVGLLDLAMRSGVGVIARTPLCFGFLSGEITPSTVFAPGDHRNRWPRAQIERWLAGADQARAIAGAGPTAVQQALRFCLSMPAVSAVIPGMLSAGEIDENAAASALGPLEPAAVAAILELNRREDFYVG